jgi:hypothetical protein
MEADWKLRGPPSMMTNVPLHGSSALDSLSAFRSYALIQAEPVLYKIPNSHVVAQYFEFFLRNDFGRTVLTILLALFAIRALLQSRTREAIGERYAIQFSEEVSLVKILSADPRPDNE